MKDYKHIIENLPSSWQELKFKDFKKLIQIPITETTDIDDLFVGLDNSVKALSVLTEMSKEELETIPLAVINQMAQRIEFLTKEPDVKNFKTSIKWKNWKEITYDNYVTFIALTKSNPYENISLLLSSFSHTKMTEEEIDSLPTSEVLAGFFLLVKKVKKYFKSSIRKTSFRLTKLMLKQAIQILCRRRTKG